MPRITTVIGVAAAAVVFGGIAPAQAAASAPTPTPTATAQQDTISHTTVLDPTHSFAMTAKPSVKATPYWGEPKAG